MKRKIRLNNPNDLKIGLRIKFSCGGWWFNSKKKTEWVKGKIIKLGPINKDGKIHYVLTKCYSKKYGNIGNLMSLNQQCDEIYKQL